MPRGTPRMLKSVVKTGRRAKATKAAAQSLCAKCVIEIRSYGF